MKKEPASGFSATPGCLIFICGLLTLAGLITWAGFTFVRQNRQIDSFTEKAPLEIAPVQVTDEERDSLIEKLESLRAAIESKSAAEIGLNVAELNTLLSLDRFSENKVNTVLLVENISEDSIRAKISFPLNSFPPGTYRYLNGTLLAQPAVNKEAGLVLNTKDIQVEGKEISEGFLQRYQQDGYLDQMLIEPFRDEEKGSEIADALKGITSVKLEEEKVIIGYLPPVAKQ